MTSCYIHLSCDKEKSQPPPAFCFHVHNYSCYVMKKKLTYPCSKFNLFFKGAVTILLSIEYKRRGREELVGEESFLSHNFKPQH